MRLTDLAIGLILGMAITSLGGIVLNFVTGLSNTTLGVLCLIQAILIVVLTLWVILLRDRLNSRESFIYRYHPGIDIDSYDEFHEAFNEAVQKIEDSSRP